MKIIKAVLWLVAVSLACPLLYFSALFLAEPLFSLRTPVQPVDVIVVLGGDGTARAVKAAAVYRSIESSRPRVLISGDSDCWDIASIMIDHGVPAQSISVECSSRNTWENAELSKPILSTMGARTGILVTTWFHVRRAMACFQAVVPEVHWGSAPVERKRSPWDMAWDTDGFQAAKEYLKVAWYAVRYGLLADLAWPLQRSRI